MIDFLFEEHDFFITFPLILFKQFDLLFLSFMIFEKLEDIEEAYFFLYLLENFNLGLFILLIEVTDDFEFVGKWSNQTLKSMHLLFFHAIFS